MRYLASLIFSLSMVVFVMWLGSQIMFMVSQGSSETADYLRGPKIDRCGYQLDARFGLAGYDLDEWKGSRCENLSELDVCVLECLSRAGAIEIAQGCFPRCVDE